MSDLSKQIEAVSHRVTWRYAYFGDLEPSSGGPGDVCSADGRDVNGESEVIVISENEGRAPFTVQPASLWADAIEGYGHAAHWAPLTEVFSAFESAGMELMRHAASARSIEREGVDFEIGELPLNAVKLRASIERDESG